MLPDQRMDPEFEDPDRTQNEEFVIGAVKKLREFPHRLGKEDPKNKLKFGWDAIWLTQVLTAVIAILLDRWHEMPVDVLIAMEYLTTDKRLQKHLAQTGQLTSTFRNLFKALRHTAYPQLFLDLLESYARSNLFCRTLAAAELEEFPTMKHSIRENHVVLLKLAGDLRHHFSGSFLNSIVCEIVTCASSYSASAIRMWQTMFERGHNIRFEKDASTGYTADYALVFSTFLKSTFLTKIYPYYIGRDEAKTEALKFLAFCANRITLKKHLQQEDLAALCDCLKSKNTRIRKAAVDVLRKIGDKFYESSDHSFEETRDGLMVLVREAMEKDDSNLDYTEDWYTLSVSFRDTIFSFFNAFEMLHADGAKHRCNSLLAKHVFAFNEHNWEDFDDTTYKILNYGITGNRPIPAEQRFTTGQIDAFLYCNKIAQNPKEYLKGVEWNLDTLQTVLHFLTMMQREKAAGTKLEQKWDRFNSCYSIAEALLRIILNPGFLIEGAEMFPVDERRALFNYPDASDFFKQLYKEIEGVKGGTVRRELNVAAEKSMKSRDMVFENILEQIVHLLEMSLLTVPRDVTSQEEFISNHLLFLEKLIRWFPLLACRLSVALTRASLEPEQFEGSDYKNQEIWEKNYNEVISNELPNRKDLVTKYPRDPENMKFLFEKKIGDSVYDHHLHESHEFRNWLTMRSFVIGTPDLEGIYTL